MPETFIYQIYYSTQTRDARDRGFVGLDNMKNERPDWREYWPIRNYLRNAPLQEGAFYGFFSPKFGLKTGLDSASVRDFAARHGDADVLLFSPFFDQIAFPINIFEQGAMQHLDTLPTFRESVLCVVPEINFDALIMNSSNTVFCNFFAAKPVFWRVWLESCEQIFRIAEKGETDLARRLNTSTNHDGRGVPAKVFVIERIASLLLTIEKRWKAKAFDSQALPWSGSALGQFRLEMSFLDALKSAYANQGHPHYLDAFHKLRQLVNRTLQESRPQP